MGVVAGFYLCVRLHVFQGMDDLQTDNKTQEGDPGKSTHSVSCS